MGTTNSQSQPVAIVTGISRGFGKAMAQCLLAAGWVVVGDSRRGWEGGRPDIGGEIGTLHLLRGDITDDAHLQSLVSLASSLGSLRLLVNNAGALGPSPLPALADLFTDQFEALFRVNAVAPLRLTQIALPTLVANGGAVVNISSDAAVETYPGWGAYAATKVALDKLTATLAQECSPVQFYSLDPGDMRTEMHQEAFPGEDISDRPEPSISAPAILKLATKSVGSGRYKAKDLLS